MQTSLRIANNAALMSSLGKGKIILSFENVDEFCQEALQCYCPLSNHMNSLLTDKKYIFPSAPHFTDTLNIPGVPTDHLIYGERDTMGVITMKLDSATLKCYREDTESHISKYNAAKLQESAVLADLRSRFSETSASQIKFFSGSDYATDSLSLSKMWWAIKASHEKANTIKMLEVISNVLNIISSGSESFYEYTDRVTSAYKQFETTFSNYLDKPLKSFADVMLVLSLVGGLNQSGGVFDTAIQKIRQIDFSTPSLLPIFPTVLKHLVEAHHSSSLLVSKSKHTFGMSAEANSSVSLTKAQCAKCKIPIERIVDQYGVSKSFCKPCSNLNYQEKKTKYLERKKTREQTTTEKKNSTKTKVSETKTPSKQTSPSTAPSSVPKATKPVIALKPASAGNFAGSTPNLAMSASHHFLLNQGENPESEFENDDEEETY